MRIKTSSKTIILQKFFILIVLIFSSNRVLAQGCKECGKRMIAIYYFEFKVPMKTHEDTIQYQDLHTGARTLHIKNAPDCIESAFQYATRNSNQSGSSYNSQYMLSGTVSGSESNYTLELRLETNAAKKLVALGSTQFETAASGIGPQIDIAYDKLTGGKNIDEVIYEYEKKQRDLNNKKNIAPRIKLHAPQTNLKQMDAIPVEVEALDCDNKPIKNRKITFVAADGKLDKNEITTNDEGKGTILYTSPKQSVYTFITAKLDYTKVYERDGVIETLEENLELIIGDPEAPPPIRFNCNATAKMQKAEEWAKKQWPVYYYNNKEGNRGYLGFWKTYKTGAVIVREYDKNGKLSGTARAGSNPEGLKLVRDEAIKRADEQMEKVKDIFEKYKSTTENCFGLNQLLLFSYDLYKNSLEKEPKWDIKKAAAEFNLQLADKYLNKLRNEHNYLATGFIRYFILQHDLFSDDKKSDEYFKKLDNAHWFKFKIFGSSTSQNEQGFGETTYDFDMPINTLNNTSVEDKMKVSYTSKPKDGERYSETNMVNVQLAWELKICDDEEKDKDDFKPAPLIPKDKSNKNQKSSDKEDDFKPVPLVPDKKPEIQFVLNWFTFEGGAYFPFDEIKNKMAEGTQKQSTTFSVTNLSAVKSFSYSHMVEDVTYITTIIITHTPR